MELSQQICSLEQAKRLRELGVEQRSVFWWCDPSDGDKTDVGFIRDNHVGYKVYFSAFTVAELGEMLKEHTFKEVDTAHGKEMWVMYCHFRECVFRCGDHIKMECVADTEADARAKMLIYLLENKLI